MISLSELKEIIGRAESELPPYPYSEIDSAVVFEEGWRHLGEDYFFNEITNEAAGPSGDGRIRILVDLIELTEAPPDISLEWERQAGTDTSWSVENADLAPELFPPFADKGRLASGKCACDS